MSFLNELINEPTPSTSGCVDFDPADLQVEEHIDGCTLKWKIPDQFLSSSAEEYTQQIIVREGIERIVHVSTLVPPPLSVFSFPTADGLIYDVLLVIKAVHDNLEASIVYDFLAAKQLALRRRKNFKTDVVDLRAQVSSLECRVSWPDSVKLARGCLKLRLGFNGVWRNVIEHPELNCFEISTVPGRKYFFELRKYHNGRLVVAGDVWFKATYSPAEVDMLYEKAVADYRFSAFRQVQVFYRCKPAAYFEAIKSNGGLMKTYQKDLTGHPASPINNRLDGLFFFARTRSNGMRPKQSPFGDTRWIVSAHFLFDPVQNNLYFADYYCTYSTHYVIVVITEKDTETDRFCDHRLTALDPSDNSFLRTTFNPKKCCFEYFVNMDVWLEIFYTDHLPLNFGVFEPVEATFKGSSSSIGLPNNKFCEKCDIYSKSDQFEE